MRNNGLRLAIFIAALYAMFTGFMSSMILEESTLPDSTQILVSGSTISTNSMGLPALTQEIANTSKSVLVKQVRDLNDTKVRNLYFAIGDKNAAQAHWLKDGYPSFSKNLDTKTLPVQQLQGLDPRGRYFIYGSDNAARTVSTEFQKLGYTTEEISVSAGQNFSLLFQGLLGAPTFVTLLLIVLLTGISVLAQMKHYAIQRLHGVTKRGAIWNDISNVLPSTSISILAITGLAILWLYSYNGLNQLWRLAETTVTIFAIAVLLVACVHFCLLVIIWNSAILPGLKGRLGFQVAVPISYLIRIPGIVLAVSLIASSFSAASSVQEAAAARSELQAAGNASKIVFEGRMSSQEMDKLAFESGAWLKQQDQRGNAILAAPYDLQVNPEKSHGKSTQDILLVNNSYIRENPVLDTEGSPEEGIEPNEIKVLFPTDSIATKDDALEFLSQFSTDFEAKIKYGEIQPAQKHFLYEPQPISSHQPQWAKNSIVVIVGAETGLIRDDDYMALASSGHVLMTDPKQATLNTPENLMGSWIAAYIPVAQVAADNLDTQISELRVKAASALMALVVLLATAVGLAQIHVQGNAQEILVRFLHGWRFYATHRWLIRAELVVLLAIFAWSFVKWLLIIMNDKIGYSPLATNGNFGPISSWQLWSLLIVAAFNFGLLFTLVRFRTQRMVRTQSEETA